MEEWKDIEDYEGLYQVSNLGKVISLHKKWKGQPKEVSAYISRQGYKRVELNNYGQKKFFVHSLVAKAFVPIPEHLKDIPIEKLQVNHKDENKLNNNADNLEWCEGKYNCNYGTRNEKIGKLHSRKVYQYTKDGQLVNIYNSAREAAKMIGGIQSNISRCCNGGFLKKGKWVNLIYHRGYKWSYELL